MKVISSADQMREACRQARRAGQRLAFVPTMGALHAGHMSLVRTARGQAGIVAVSIFVNPLQFGPNEDFARYPRTLERDRPMLEAERVDLLFTPSADEMYPKDAATFVEVEGLSNRLCGRSRPGHFRGVTTVVAKLFHIVEPDLAFFGQKDAAQVAVIRRMVRDLNFGVEIVVGPTVREPDGLALSSRNAYLDPQQHKQALALYRALMRVQTMSDQGEHDAGRLMEAGKQVIAEEAAVRLDYFEIVDPNSLEPLRDTSRGALVAVAAFVGQTRLIDNVVLQGAGVARGPQMA